MRSGSRIASRRQNGTVTALAQTAVYLDRIARARTAMEDAGVDALLVSVGSDLPYLTGYEAMPLERLTMLVVPRDGEATMVIPRLEAPRVVPQPGVFELRRWDEVEDPVAIVAGLVEARCRPSKIAVGDTMWARFLVALLEHWPSDGTHYVRSAAVMNPLRIRKDRAEIDALVAAGAAADRVAAQLQAGEIELVGRTEAAVSADIGARLLAEGHDVVNFAIVAAGANAASPHHHASVPGDLAPANWCCATSAGRWPATAATSPVACRSVRRRRRWPRRMRCCTRRRPPGVAAAVVGAACEDVDRASRRVIDEAGYGEWFIHRTGHGIGMEAHEDPYMVEGNTLPIAPGHAFSVEPGIYLDGRLGMRLEDCVVATDDGPLPLNRADHSLVVLDA